MKIIIDVRTREEFESGHIEGSKNIPVQEILEHVEEIKAMKSPIVFCCASGQRSGMAAQYFKEQGVDCSNGGGWRELQSSIS
ncbi:MAG: rhodanese-like domain-containing protein [Flavobacteriales bacterium]|jgi:phage shock protein E|nr:rhodanese-like domain-containing protein [Flavobacteriales bacterium]MBT5932985.1 rhodanese-like domain-containing protein [Flavobacteriales bacterium]MDO7609571.1 rhodanese-like domain-containing protein [Crocinitomicaceae bacterium]MDO7613858.1 rhodanese-like domain-containing protein [Crocinitomicaceae bacterium]